MVESSRSAPNAIESIISIALEIGPDDLAIDPISVLLVVADPRSN